MKTNLLFLAFFSLLLFSCDEDKDDNNNDESLFSSTNYIYEGDLRNYYLETENARLNDSIVVWNGLGPNDPGYDDAEGNIAGANEEIASNEQEASSIVSPANTFFIVPKIPPIPPTPLPCLCLIEYNSIRNIVLQPGTDQISLKIISVEDQGVLVSTNENTQINTIPNTDELGRYQSFELTQDGFTGEAEIIVETENGSYSLLVYFQNLE